MRVSTKGRYALAALIYLAKNSNNDKFITVIHISEKLGFSKIYLEQTFALLKRAGLVISVKGAQGGYKLSTKPKLINVFDVLNATETVLFDNTEKTVQEKYHELEDTLQSCVYEPLSDTIKTMLTNITIHDLVTETEKREPDIGYMYFI